MQNYRYTTYSTDKIKLNSKTVNNKKIIQVNNRDKAHLFIVLGSTSTVE